MDIVAGLERLEPTPEPAFVVVGVFDGLHRGHAYLLRRLVAEARRRSARPVVITFDHHPDEIITGSAPPLLCDPEERLARLAATGVGSTVVVHFDRRLRETTYDAFVGQITDRVPFAGFLMTPDAAFGYQRAGTPAALADLGRRDGFAVVVVPPFELDGQPVRSTDIRAAIGGGDLARARHLLGRAHAVAGRPRPVAGDGVALDVPIPVALPPAGRYRVGVEPAWSTGTTRSRLRPGAATIADGQLLADGDLPSPRARIALLERMSDA